MHDSSTKEILGRLVRDYVSSYKPTVALAVICMVVAAITAAGTAWILQPALDHIFINKDRDMLVIIPVIVVVLVVVGAIASYGQTILMRKVGQGILAKVQVDLFKHLLQADIGLFHDQSSGKLISRFTNDIQLMRNAVSSLLTGLAKEALSMIFLVGVMIYQSWQLSVIALILLPLAFYPIVKLGKRMRKVASGTQEELSQFAGQLDEVFSSVRAVKAYGREGFEVKRAKKTVNRLYNFYMKASKIQALASPMMEVLGGVAIAGVIGYGGMQVIEGTTTAGAFFSFMAAMMMAYKPVRAVAGMNTQLQEGLAAARRVYAVLDTEPKVVDLPDAQPLKVTGGEIQFSNAIFAYDNGVEVISNVNINIPSGKMVALVGASGSGKSTIMNLLMRFYDVSSGKVTIDGQNVRNLTMDSLRKNMALVSQEVMLFDDTIFANIAYGRAGASVQDVENAAKSAAAHDFITKLPDGYNTRIGAHGAKLSGGQRQRLSIARAMLKDAPILLLDEATSALDTASEMLVQKALDELTKHRTTLVIAHRLSTVRHADIIYVLDDGKIVESGTHDSLLQAAGAYANLQSSQIVP